MSRSLGKALKGILNYIAVLVCFVVLLVPWILIFGIIVLLFVALCIYLF